MLATLVRLACDLVQYEAQRKEIPTEEVRWNYLCDPVDRREQDVMVVALDVTTGKMRQEDYKDEERWKYLYAKPRSNHCIGPSWVFEPRRQGRTPEGHAESALKEWRNGIAKLKDRVKGPKRTWLERACQAVQSLSHKHKQLIQYATKPINLLVVTEGNIKPGEIPEVREAFFWNRMFGGEMAESKGQGICGICGSSGQVSSTVPLPFFTVDKRNFFPMGNQRAAWRNAPVCQKCAEWLYIASSLMKERLRASVAGYPAFVIPELGPAAGALYGPFAAYLWEFRERSAQRFVPSADEVPRAAGSAESDNLFEGLIEGLMKQAEAELSPPFRSLSLVFHEPGQKFRVLYVTSEILPTRLRNVATAIEKVRHLLQDGVLGEPGERVAGRIRRDLEFLALAWRWPRAGRERRSPLSLNPMILTETLLKGLPLPANVFWGDADQLLRALLAQTWHEDGRTIKQAVAERCALLWAIWMLLNIVSGKEEAGMTPKTLAFHGSRLSSDFWEDFFKEKRLLTSNAARGFFLLGVLFGQVEYAQRNEREDSRGEMPILRELRGLTVRAKELRERLFPTLVMRLRQLERATQATEEVEAAAAHFLSASEPISDQEARFFLCLGWALSEHTVNAVRQALP